MELTRLQTLSTAELAKLLGKSVGTLENWRCIGKGPKFTKPEGTRGFYLVDDVVAWMTGEDR